MRTSISAAKNTVRSNNPNDANVVANSVIDANGSGMRLYLIRWRRKQCSCRFYNHRGNIDSGGGIYINEASPVVERNVITATDNR